MAAPEETLTALAAAVAVSTAALLAAARAGDWAGLSRLEAAHQQRVDTWRGRVAQGESTPAAARPAIEAALADETELRRLITARLTELSGDLQSVGNKKRLLTAYGA